MARFKNKDLRLSANEEILFGNAQEASLKYDGSDLVTGHILKHSTQGYFATQEFVNDALMGLEWQDSVLSMVTDIPAGVYGERYIIPAGATGAWSGRDDDIAEYTTTWVYTTPSAGFATWVEDEGAYFVYSGSAWVRMGTVVDHSLLDNLDVDDHTQYLLADGSRELSGTLQAVSVSAGTFEGPGYTHADLIDVHNLTTDINHNLLTNTHNLTTSIDHNTINNNHNLTTSIDHNTINNNHNLTTDINHDTLTNYVANKHIDWTNASDNLLTSENVSAADFYGDDVYVDHIRPYGNIFLLDGSMLHMGDTLEASLRHSGADTYLDTNTGNTYIRTGATLKDAIICTPDAQVTLYHNDNAKIATTATGIDVTGEIQGDTFTAGPSAGVTGWFDDGANFRVTVDAGIVTDIGASVGGGIG